MHLYAVLYSSQMSEFRQDLKQKSPMRWAGQWFPWAVSVAETPYRSPPPRTHTVLSSGGCTDIHSKQSRCLGDLNTS